MDHPAILSTLDGVTTVLVGFIFVCLIFPSIVKNRPQFYAALAMIVFILLLHTMTLMLNKTDAIVVAGGVFTGLLQICALLLLVLCVGGLTARQLAGDMARAYEVMRRGDSQKEVIIPIGRQAARQPAQESGASTVYHVDSGHTAGEASEKHEDPDESLPLT